MDDINKKVIRIIIGFVSFIIVFIVDKYTNFSVHIDFFLYLIPYIISSYDSFIESFEEFREGNIFNENFLMIIASLGAMIMCFIPNADSMFLEGIFVMLFFSIGELFEMIAEGKSERSIKSLMDIRPDYANLICNGKVNKVDPNIVKINDVIVIKPGEKVPLDGIVKKGTTFMNTLYVTGESVPRKIVEDDLVYSGFINESSVIEVVATNTFKDSTASKIIELVKNASSKKSSKEKFITSFSKIYTPIVIILALFIMLFFGIITGDYISWIKRGLNFLVVSCPCALVISVPLAYFGGIGKASRNGILFKGANYLESISKVNTIFFDKTGTLTEGVFEVVAIHPNEVSEKALLHIASHIEKYSTHPVAASIIEYYNKDNDLDDKCKIENIKEIAGFGMSATVNGEKFYVGSSRLMEKYKINYLDCEKKGTVIHLASKEKYYGHIIISDRIKSDSKNVIDFLSNNNINVIMLTGDKEETANQVSTSLGITNYVSGLLPQEKVMYVEKELNKNSIVSFVGDGINDAIALTRSDIGISMGKKSSQAAVESADVVFMNDKISNIIDAIKISKKTNLIARENIFLSIGIKFIILVLSVLGITSMWAAVFADVGVTILAILNSIRTLK